ncbi:hypothetical protein ACIQBJ_16045 [Kitasatospora sp. NPDC088391]|uniref:hypothetical protein n=1 Tax=Kitasatospora sp. NPDC088391 TaxID=3364074 RepID=UPI00382E335E
MSGAGPGTLREVAELLRQVLDEDADWLDAVRADTLVDGELLVESHELAAWSLALAARYGPGVDLAGHVAGLDLDAIVALTVGEVAALALAGGAAPTGQGPGPGSDSANGRVEDGN